MLRGSLTDLLSLDTPLPIGSELQQLSAERKTAISSMNLHCEATATTYLPTNSFRPPLTIYFLVVIDNSDHLRFSRVSLWRLHIGSFSLFPMRGKALKLSLTPPLL